MTTMLELAARAIHDADQRRDPIVPDWEWVSQDAYMSMARAVLMAVREPDGDVVAAGERAAWDSSNSMPAIRAMSVGFGAMIDAILAGDA